MWTSGKTVLDILRVVILIREEEDWYVGLRVAGKVIWYPLDDEEARKLMATLKRASWWIGGDIALHPGFVHALRLTDDGWFVGLNWEDGSLEQEIHPDDALVLQEHLVKSSMPYEPAKMSDIKSLIRRAGAE